MGNKLNLIMFLLLKFVVVLTLLHDSYSEQTQQQHEVPHADQLRRLINRYLFGHLNAPAGSNLREYVFNGPVSKVSSPLDEYKTLNPKNIKNIIQLAKRPGIIGDHDAARAFDEWERKLDFISRTNKNMSWFLDEEKDKEEFDKLKEKFLKDTKKNKNRNQNNMAPNPVKKQSIYSINNFRRQLYYQHRENMLHTNNILNIETNHELVDYMMQSVISTRFTLRKTHEIRKKYKLDASYRIAIMHSMAVEYLLKIRLLFTTMYRDRFQTHSPGVRFIHSLALYEKSLQAHTDITTLVRKIFDEHWNFYHIKEKLIEKKKGPPVALPESSTGVTTN